MALETGPESPVPVRTVSQMLSDWIGKLGAIWVEGEVADFRPRSQARMQFLTLRDIEANASLTVVADSELVGRLDPPLEPGARIVVWARPEFWAGRGSLQL
ncbi:MAG: exodeoxyribonuclease VII large subunit, partial [Actinomycetota bacterium]|nr:exodeoxyribonuclease VII large subunit [Actinomycetota bacterium]